MKHYWNNLQQREQRLIIAGGLVLVILLGYFLILAPYWQFVTNKQQRINNQQQFLSWLSQAQHQIATLQQTHSGTKAAITQSLPSVVENHLREKNLPPDQLSESGNKQVTLKFNEVSFDDLMRWLIALTQQYDIDIKQYSIREMKENGMVQATIQLAQPEDARQ